MEPPRPRRTRRQVTNWAMAALILYTLYKVYTAGIKSWFGPGSTQLMQPGWSSFAVVVAALVVVSVVAGAGWRPRI
jgi:uncharacterized membrane protein required for colicin V production